MIHLNKYLFNKSGKNLKFLNYKQHIQQHIFNKHYQFHSNLRDRCLYINYFINIQILHIKYNYFINFQCSLRKLYDNFCKSNQKNHHSNKVRNFQDKNYSKSICLDCKLNNQQPKIHYIYYNQNDKFCRYYQLYFHNNCWDKLYCNYYYRGIFHLHMINSCLQLIQNKQHSHYMVDMLNLKYDHRYHLDRYQCKYWQINKDYFHKISNQCLKKQNR